jgi:hypothetical protein
MSSKLMQAIAQTGAISSGRQVTYQNDGTYAIYAAAKKKYVGISIASS